MKRKQIKSISLITLLVTILLLMPYLFKNHLFKEIIKSYSTWAELDCEHAYLYIEGQKLSQDLFIDIELPCDSIRIVKDSIEFRKVQKLWDKILFWTEMRQYSFYVISVTTLYVNNEAIIFRQDYIWLLFGWLRIKQEYLGTS